MNPKNAKNQKFLLTLDPEVAQVLEAISDEIGATVPGFVRNWMTESLPALCQILTAIQTAKAGNIAGAATRFAADMGRAQADGQLQIADLLDQVAEKTPAQASKVLAEPAPKKATTKAPSKKGAKK